MPDQYFYKGERVSIIRRTGNLCIISLSTQSISVNLNDLVILSEENQDLNQLENLNNLISLTEIKEERKRQEELKREELALTVPIGTDDVNVISTSSDPETVTNTDKSKPLKINELQLDTDLAKIAKDFPGIGRLTLVNLLNCRPIEGYRDIPHVKEQFSQHSIKSNINWKVLEQTLVF
jgi:hypothetical protein